MRVSAINNFKINTINNKSTIQKNIYSRNLQNSDSLTIGNSRKYSQAIAFEGASLNGLVRQRGMYHHISALPAKGSFCGQFLDAETVKFINFLKKAKQTHWIVNPLNELSEDMCPYNPIGRFSKNKYLVNLNVLTNNEYGKLLHPKELSSFDTSSTFTLEMLKTQKDPLFKIAYNRFIKFPKSSGLKKEYENFCAKNDSVWLDTYATYDVISRNFGQSWYQWDEKFITAPERVTPEKSLDDVVLSAFKETGHTISPTEYMQAKNLYKFEQFLFDKQFKETLKSMGKDLKMMTDFPIGVCADGVDTWFKKDMFLLDKETFKPTVVTGCPSQKDGKPFTQVWGHAQLDFSKQATWDYLEASLNQMLEVTDVRLDHFAAYANRANIPTKFIDKTGRVLEGNDIFKKEPFGMGVGFFDESWIENIAEKKNPKNGENVFEMFMRLAKENGKDPKDAYMIESLGQLTNEMFISMVLKKNMGTCLHIKELFFLKIWMI